ncbi:MAG TPA: exosortase O [Anaerolineales bacterium]|nr:exosortase O [Anaerolineales bacterium]
MQSPARQDQPDSAASLTLPARLAANAGILVLWFWLYRPVYRYLGVIFTREEFRTNQIVLVGVIALIAMQVRRGDLRLRMDVLPQLYPPALGLALLGSALFLAAEHFLDINTLSASLFGLGCYGLLGLWMRPRQWRQGLPAALLLIGALPFGEHMETFVGYPVRLLTARIVRDGLAAIGYPAIGVETILVFENGVSQVDLPCSGVKSLWTGGLFLLAASWIERRQLNLRWVLVAISFAVLLLGANLLRVALLVFTGQVMGWRLLAEMLHVPLGVIGFVAACAAAVYLLRWLVPELPPSAVFSQAQAAPGSEPGVEIPDGYRPRPTWLPALLAAVLLLLVLLYHPRPQVAAAQSMPGWQFDPQLNAEPWPFSPGELAWLSQGDPLEAQRWRFEWRGFSGSLLFITSQTWRAHHRPERCFEVYGLRIENSYVMLAAPDFPIRQVTLGQGEYHNLYSAIYWFQSRQQTTDDYGTRMWADLPTETEPWVLVTVLFDQAYNPQDETLLDLYAALRQTVQRSLEGGNNP